MIEEGRKPKALFKVILGWEFNGYTMKCEHTLLGCANSRFLQARRVDSLDSKQQSVSQCIKLRRSVASLADWLENEG